MERLFNAIKHPYVHMIAHPTGRIIGEREGYRPDVQQLIYWAKEYGKILELNASPYRLDLCVEHLKLAMELGVPIAINTDAHAIEQLEYMEIGTKYAQKAWLKKSLLSIHGASRSLKRLFGEISNQYVDRQECSE